MQVYTNPEFFSPVFPLFGPITHYLSRKRSFASRSIFDDDSKKRYIIRLENSNLLVKAISSSAM